ncbi:hypothetical protein TNCV_4756521 [Trichonephila clavipes]|nr:hypothetical protein TNCV_4756521 [Trichonephila clavipes]
MKQVNPPAQQLTDTLKSEKNMFDKVDVINPCGNSTHSSNKAHTLKFTNEAGLQAAIEHPVTYHSRSMELRPVDIADHSNRYIFSNWERYLSSIKINHETLSSTDHSGPFRHR